MKAPILYHVVLPPSHPFHAWDEKTRIEWFGPHTQIHVAQPIPTETGMSKKPKPTKRKPKPMGY